MSTHDGSYHSDGDLNQHRDIKWTNSSSGLFIKYIYLPTPPPGQDRTQGQFLSRV